jgi:phage terminase small subunit
MGRFLTTNRKYGILQPDNNVILEDTMGIEGAPVGIERKRALADKYLENKGNKTQAWIDAIKPSCTDRKAAAQSALHAFKDQEVIDMIAADQELLRDRFDVTIHTVLAELEEARQLAMNGHAETGARANASAAVSAIMGKAKVMGLDKQIIDHVSSDGSMSPEKVLSGRDLRDALEKEGLLGLIDATDK